MEPSSKDIAKMDDFFPFHLLSKSPCLDPLDILPIDLFESILKNQDKSNLKSFSAVSHSWCKAVSIFIIDTERHEYKIIMMVVDIFFQTMKSTSPLEIKNHNKYLQKLSSIKNNTENKSLADTSSNVPIENLFLIIKLKSSMDQLVERLRCELSHVVGPVMRRLMNEEDIRYAQFTKPFHDSLNVSLILEFARAHVKSSVESDKMLRNSALAASCYDLAVYHREFDKSLEIANNISNHSFKRKLLVFVGDSLLRSRKDRYCRATMPSTSEEEFKPSDEAFRLFNEFINKVSLKEGRLEIKL